MKPLTWIVDRPPTKTEARNSTKLYVTYSDGRVGREDGDYIRECMNKPNSYPMNVIAWMPIPEPYEPNEKA